jgi:hypothetical protein
MRSSTPSTDESIVLRFPHHKEHLRKIVVRDEGGEYEVYRLAPSVADWPAADVPDDVNPRSHDEECLKGKVARDIEDTLRNAPQDFWLANRGGYVLADRVRFDPEKQVLEIVITDTDIHGIADGATSNAVIKKLQNEWRAKQDAELGMALAAARFNLDVVVGMTDRDRIAKLVQGRNRSVQVTEWSLADFKGQFDWLKNFIDREDGPFKGRIGWEENAGKPVSVLDVISLMTLFHPIYDDPTERRRRAPTVAFSSKGTAHGRFGDENLTGGYQALTPVLDDILRLHDHVFANFGEVYRRYVEEIHSKQGRLGKRRGFEAKSTHLPLTGTESEYRIDKGVIFPLLASFRALLEFRKDKASWKVDPFAFFDDYGPDLMAVLIEQLELCNGNPATTGKTKAVYTSLHNQARLLLNDRLAEDN